MAAQDDDLLSAFPPESIVPAALICLVTGIKLAAAAGIDVGEERIMGCFDAWEQSSEDFCSRQAEALAVRATRLTGVRLEEDSKR